jgi:hypothetical protein
MIVRDKKHFVIGLFMIIVFAAVLFCMFMPIYRGHNALEYSDKLFNSMAKGSTYYIKGLEEKSLKYKDVTLTMKLKVTDPDKAALMTKVLSGYGQISPNESGLTFTTNIGDILFAALEDSDAMFFNKDKQVEQKYGIPGKTVMYGWWLSARAMENSLKAQKKFKIAAQFAEVNKKAIEVGYNFFGIDSEKANEEVELLAFSLVFYVIYTLWWGMAILSMFQAFGLKMTRGSKSEA